MALTLAQVTFLVREYDEAIAYFTEKLGFLLIEDTPLSGDKRWVVIKPDGPASSSLLLAQPATQRQLDCIGNQTGGRVFLFLYSDDFWRDYSVMRSRGVNFLESPREEPYGTVAVFADLYGNRWDLLMPKPA